MQHLLPPVRGSHAVGSPSHIPLRSQANAFGVQLHSGDIMSALRGRSSMVERQPSKLNVRGSSPLARCSASPRT